MTAVGEPVDLDVGGPAHGGSCVARLDGRAVFVRHALPGERVRAVVTEDRGEWLRADAVEVLAASPDRVAPPCPYAGPGRCGGCDWQHATLPAQRRLKAAVVHDALARFAGLDRAVVVEPVPGDVDGLSWRTRVQFAVDAGGRVGLRRHRSHDVEPVDRCLIAAPGVEDVGVEALAWPGAESVEVIVGSTGDRAVVVTGGLGAGRRKPDSRASVSLPRLPEGVSVLRGDGRGGAEPVTGRPGVREVVGERSFWVSGSGFWQVHPGAATALAEAVLAYADPRPGDRALDLYGGVGLFAAALAPRVREVTLVESSAPACADARQNLRDLPTARVEHGRVDAVLRRLGLGSADVVVLDPPRDGAGAAVAGLVAALGPRAIVHVACDPVALARDVAHFGGHGYELAELRAFDLFPMTHHVECVALLSWTAP